MKILNLLTGISLMLLVLACGKGNTLYDASGTFEATEILVSSEASGKIMAFTVQEGQKLDSNQIVGFIDSTQLYLKKQQLLASMKALQVRRPETAKQIAVLQQQIASAKTEKNRAENLVKANAANQKTLDDITAQIAVLEKQLAAQKSSLDISNEGISTDLSTLEIQVAQLDDQIKKCRIVSPVSGTLLVKYAESGELAVPGKALFKLADIDNMILRAYLTSDQLTTVKLNQLVKVYADFGTQTREYSGTISWISDKAEFTPKTIQTKDERANLVYAVKITVGNDGFLKIGMYGQINLTLDNRQ